MKMEDIKTPSASLTTTLAGRLAGVVAYNVQENREKMLLISGFVVFHSQHFFSAGIGGWSGTFVQ